MPHPAYPAYYYFRILKVLLRDVEDDMECQDILFRFITAWLQVVVMEKHD